MSIVFASTVFVLCFFYLCHVYRVCVYSVCVVWPLCLCYFCRTGLSHTSISISRSSTVDSVLKELLVQLGRQVLTASCLFGSVVPECGNVFTGRNHFCFFGNASFGCFCVSMCLFFMTDTIGWQLRSLCFCLERNSNQTPQGTPNTNWAVARFHMFK